MRRRVLALGAVVLLGACLDELSPGPSIQPVPADPSTHVVEGPPTVSGPYERIVLGGQSAQDINSRGQVVVRNGAQSFVWYRGESRVLPSLGGTATLGLDINESGQVAGASQAADGSWRIFLWTDGVIQDLGAANPQSVGGYVPNLRPRTSRMLNDRGEVVWTVGSSGAQRVMLWRNGAAQDIGTLGGPTASASTINEAGQVAGISALAGDTLSHVFLWTDGVMQDLGPSFGRPVSVFDLNDSGWVLIEAFKPPPGGCCTQQRLLLWDGVQRSDITAGNNSFAAGINNSGVVAASRAFDAGSSSLTPFLWEQGAVRFLGQSGGQQPGTAVALSEGATVAGYTSSSETMSAAAYEGDSTWLLEPRASFSSPRSQALALNVHADVVGWAQSRGGILWRRIHQANIDVKPGEDGNPINRNSGGMVPVALLSTTAFDAGTANIVAFAGASPVNRAAEDVNGDGLTDALFLFEARALQLADDATTACLRGERTNGAAFKGCNAIRIVK